MEPIAVVHEPRRSLTQQVTEEITTWITTGRYAPGDHLPPEAELARIFNVSKPSVREALKHLVAVGAVEISHGKPPTVSQMNSVPLVNFFHLAVNSGNESLREAVELRRGLEIESMLLATERATPEDIARLGKLIETLDRHKADYDQWVPAHVEFHAALVAASHNRFYTFLQDALKSTIERINRQIIAAQPARDPAVSFRRHVELFEAIKSGKRDKAREAIERHFDAVDAIVNATVRKAGRQG
ncbi:FadR/GntR family transcriptional regulator [Pseudoduganella lutea]|nr:FadR/GntR family transcriptional regulator [Pseudoduganella lutea]